MRWLAACVLVAALATAAFPVGQAQGVTEVTVVATEGPDCPAPEGKALCLLVEEGSPADIPQGTLVALTLRAEGQAPHNVHVTTPSEADANHTDTPASAAFAQTETIEPGSETNLTFQVPWDAEGLYLWCDVGNHEPLGMWISVETTPAERPSNETTTDDEDDAGEEDETNETSPPPQNGSEDANASENDSTPPGEDAGEEDGVPGPGGLALLAVLAVAALQRTRDR